MTGTIVAWLDEGDEIEVDPYTTAGNTEELVPLSSSDATREEFPALVEVFVNVRIGPAAAR